MSATAFPSGVLGTPVEVVETPAPLLVERKALREGSGGDGRFRGGLGQVLGFRVLTGDPATCSVFCDRTVIPAQGFFGSGPGATGALLINGKAPENPKAEQILQPGDLIELFLTLTRLALSSGWTDSTRGAGGAPAVAKDAASIPAGCANFIFPASADRGPHQDGTLVARRRRM